MPIGVSTKLSDEQRQTLLEFIGVRRVFDRHELDWIANNLVSRPPGGKARVKGLWAGAALMRAATASGIRLLSGYHLQTDELDLTRSLKHFVWFACQGCGEHDEQLAYYYRKRRHQKRLCGECYKPFLYDDEWRANNSAAQAIAQNLSETLEKQRASLKAAWAKPEVAGPWLEGIRRDHAKRDDEFYRAVGNIIKKRWKDPDYRDACTATGHSNITGHYNGVRFASLLELAFLMKESGNTLLRRYVGVGIRYHQLDGSEHGYYPDFQDDKRIIEVKSRYWYEQHKDVILAKNAACREFCRQNGLTFRFVLDKDIGRSWYKKAKKWHEAQVEKVRQAHGESPRSDG
jgi:hypothetical protein